MESNINHYAAIGLRDTVNKIINSKIMKDFSNPHIIVDIKEVNDLQHVLYDLCTEQQVVHIPLNMDATHVYDVSEIREILHKTIQTHWQEALINAPSHKDTTDWNTFAQLYWQTTN